MSMRDSLSSGGGGGSGSDTSDSTDDSTGSSDDDQLTSGGSGTSESTDDSTGSSDDDQLTSGGSDSGESSFDGDPTPEADDGTSDDDQVVRGDDGGGGSTFRGDPTPEADDGTADDDQVVRGDDDGSSAFDEPPERADRDDFGDGFDSPEQTDDFDGADGDRLREEVAEQTEFGSDDIVLTDVERDDGRFDVEFGLTSEAAEDFTRDEAAAAFDEQTPLVDVGADDIVFDGQQPELSASAQADVARERAADADDDLEVGDLDVQFDGETGDVQAVEAPGAVEPSVNVGDETSIAADGEQSARDEFRAEAAEEFGVAEDDVDIEQTDGELIATPDTGGSVDASVGVDAIPFAGSEFGFDDLPEPGDQLGFEDFAGPLRREAEQAGEAVDRATIVPPLETTPAGRVQGAIDDFEVDDIPGAGAQIGEEEIRGFEVDDIPGAGAEIGADDLSDAGDRVRDSAADSFAGTPGDRAVTAVDDFEVGDIPGAGAEISADDLDQELSQRLDGIDVGAVPGAGGQAGVEDIPRSGDRAGSGLSTGESALALGAAGFVAPEPATTVGGAALATVGAGALAIDAVRQSEIDTPERGDLIGGGAGVGRSEIEQPEDRSLTSELEVGTGDVEVTEVDAPADGEGVEFDQSELGVGDPTATDGEVSIPSVDAEQVGSLRDPLQRERDDDLIDDTGPTVIGEEDIEDTGPLVDIPEQEQMRQIREELERRQEFEREDFSPLEEGGGVRFPAEEVTRTVEAPAAESPQTAAQESFVDTGAAGVGGDIDLVTGIETQTDQASRQDTAPDVAQAGQIDQGVGTQPAAPQLADLAVELPQQAVEAPAFESPSLQQTTVQESFAQETVTREATVNRTSESRFPVFAEGDIEADEDMMLGLDEEQFELELEDPDFLGGR